MFLYFHVKMPGIRNDFRKLVDNTNTVNYLSQFKNSSIGANITAGKIRCHFFAGNHFESKRKLGIFSHGKLNSFVSYLFVVIGLTTI